MLLDEKFRLEQRSPWCWRYQTVGVLALLATVLSLVTLRPGQLPAQQPTTAEAKTATPSVSSSPYRYAAVRPFQRLPEKAGEKQATFKGTLRSADGKPLPETGWLQIRSFIVSQRGGTTSCDVWDNAVPVKEGFVFPVPPGKCWHTFAYLPDVFQRLRLASGTRRRRSGHSKARPARRSAGSPSSSEKASP